MTATMQSATSAYYDEHKREAPVSLNDEEWEFDDQEVCGVDGPITFPGTWPYRCTKPPGHPGAHVATDTNGRVYDTWPQDPV